MLSQFLQQTKLCCLLFLFLFCLFEKIRPFKHWCLHLIQYLNLYRYTLKVITSFQNQKQLICSRSDGILPRYKEAEIKKNEYAVLDNEELKNLDYYLL